MTGRRSGPNESVVPPTCQHSEPADTPARTTPARHTSSEDAVEAVEAPDGQKVRHASASDPDHVVFEQETGHVAHARHREQFRCVTSMPAARPASSTRHCGNRWSPFGRAEVAHPWCPSRSRRTARSAWNTKGANASSCASRVRRLLRLRGSSGTSAGIATSVATVPARKRGSRGP